jgi:phosphoribosylanthranilate isomerase
MKDIVQIAGINNASEAKMVAKCGADYIGFPLRLDAKKPDISEGEAAKIIEGLKPPTYGVAITYLTDPHEIVELCRSLHCDIVQLHGDVSFGELVRLRSIAPKLRIIKALIVQGSNLPSLQAEVTRMAPHVDAFITDTFDPETGARGATGKKHDWAISRKLVELSPRPVILAGGLTADNVGQAIREVKPAGVDAHTGVEDANGKKSPEAVAAFVTRAKEAFESL